MDSLTKGRALRVYIINRVRFYSLADATRYVENLGWKIVTWETGGFNEVLLRCEPETVNKKRK
jgi:hypothetical protein